MQNKNIAICHKPMWMPARENSQLFIASNNEKHHPDLGSEGSSGWNFCVCSPNIIL